MQAMHTLARDHLLRAVNSLEGDDDRIEEIRYIITRTITLLEDHEQGTYNPRGNIVEISDYAHLRVAKARPA